MQVLSGTSLDSGPCGTNWGTIAAQSRINRTLSFPGWPRYTPIPRYSRRTTMSAFPTTIAEETGSPEQGPSRHPDMLQDDDEHDFQNEESRRCPSPVPTEIGDGPDGTTHEDVVPVLEAMRIGYRDFASEPPPLSSIDMVSHSSAIADHDLTLSMPRTGPIDGRVLFIVTELGIVTDEEACARWEQMDWDELQRYKDENPRPRRPMRSWVPLRLPMTAEERAGCLRAWKQRLEQREKVREEERKKEEREAFEEERVRVVMEALHASQAREEEEHSQAVSKGKRRADDASQPGSPKRQRMTPPPSGSPPLPIPGLYRQGQPIQIQPDPYSSEEPSSQSLSQPRRRRRLAVAPPSRSPSSIAVTSQPHSRALSPSAEADLTSSEADADREGTPPLEEEVEPLQQRNTLARLGRQQTFYHL
ncbi:hypothetical protein C8J56DRAFT_1025220 [Mycena floridula]|nr:hypothetical protein C8J56DRAFT_1025220 [Mycena floridula]